jgi:hypothetical protein
VSDFASAHSDVANLVAMPIMRHVHDAADQASERVVSQDRHLPIDTGVVKLAAFRMMLFQMFLNALVMLPMQQAIERGVTRNTSTHLQRNCHLSGIQMMMFHTCLKGDL